MRAATSRGLSLALCAGVLLGFLPCGMGWASTRDLASERFRLSEVGGGLGVSVDKTVVFFAVREKEKSGAPLYWYAEQRAVDDDWCGGKDAADGRCVRKISEVHQWLDGRSCPALAKVLTAISDLPARRLAPSDSLIESYQSDTPLISLEGWAAVQDGFGVKLTQSEYSGALVRWWRAGEAVLKPCWRNDPILLNGRPEVRLNGPAAKAP